jgi:hypothetical protein
MNTDTANETVRGNGDDTAAKTTTAAAARVISDPNDVANVVLMQIDAVNDRKNELTIVVKGLTDLTKQLARAYADQAATIVALRSRVNELEAETGRSRSPG